MGRFAVKALVEKSAALDDKIVRVASDGLTFGEVAEVIASVARKEVKVYW